VDAAAEERSRRRRRAAGDLRCSRRGVWEDVAERGLRGVAARWADDALPASGASARFEPRRWRQEQDRPWRKATLTTGSLHKGYRRRRMDRFSLHASPDDV